MANKQLDCVGVDPKFSSLIDVINYKYVVSKLAGKLMAPTHHLIKTMGLCSQKPIYISLNTDDIATTCTKGGVLQLYDHPCTMKTPGSTFETLRRLLDREYSMHVYCIYNRSYVQIFINLRRVKRWLACFPLEMFYCDKYAILYWTHHSARWRFQNIGQTLVFTLFLTIIDLPHLPQHCPSTNTFL